MNSGSHAAFEGVITNLERRYRETNSEYIREKISEFMSDRPCPTCKGKRLNPAALAVTVDDINIVDANSWPVLKTLEWVKKIAGKEFAAYTQNKRRLPNALFKEISERLTFLVNVGLDYLTLNRSATTLSGGEAQRIRLATQVGSRLVGVLYVLDEPSIGLHPRDNSRLLDTLKGLRDLGNTVLVVEHDDETIREADWVIDLGPAAGEHGGQCHCRGNTEADFGAPKVVDRAIFVGAQTDRNPEAEAGRKRQIAEDHQCIRKQSKGIGYLHPSGKVGVHYRCFWVGQVHVDERYFVQCACVQVDGRADFCG